MNRLAKINANHRKQSTCCEYVEVTVTHVESRPDLQRQPKFIMEKVLTNDFNGYEGYAQYMRQWYPKVDSPGFRNSKTCKTKYIFEQKFSLNTDL